MFEMLEPSLLEHKAVSQEDYHKAREIQKKTGGVIGMILLNLGAISERCLTRYLVLSREQETQF